MTSVRYNHMPRSLPKQYLKPDSKFDCHENNDLYIMKTSQRSEFCELLQEVQVDVIMNEKRRLRRCSSCTGIETFSCSVRDICKGWRGRSFHKSRIKDESTKSLPRSHFCVNSIDNGKLLGSGGFGTVFEADMKGHRVAVKRMHRTLRNPRAMYESLQAEKLVLSLRHPNIVQTFAILENEDLSQVLIIMQFAGERNLQSLIDNERENIDMTRRLNFATNITRALQFIHDNNLAHLDLKPANVIVDTYDTCRLGDFGCCQLVTTGSNEQECLPPSPTPSPPSSRSSLTGTYAYRAPELLKGEEPTVKADMYSLGICLWQMLTREQPYGLESQFVVIFGVVANQMRPSLLQVGPTHDITMYAFTELMTRLWQADPERRPSATTTLTSLLAVKTLCKTLSHSL